MIYISGIFVLDGRLEMKYLTILMDSLYMSADEAKSKAN